MRISAKFRVFFALLAGALLNLLPLAEADAASARIKDIVNVEGVRDNQLVGYGLVVGLNGTGDGLTNSPFTKQSLQAMLERMGVNTVGQNMRTGNVAAVMVTANLAPFSTQGTRLDVDVASLGDRCSARTGKSTPSRRARSPSTVSRRRAIRPRSFRACPPPGASPPAA